MKATIHKNNKTYEVDLSKPLDISIPLREGMQNVNCFFAPPVDISPVRFGDFVGSTQEGGLLNFKNVRINPHGNGTHTECVGHISKAVYNLPDSLEVFHFLAKLVTIIPTRVGEDRIILKEQITEVFKNNEAEAIVIRTFPNDDLKKRTNYSGGNPTYIHHEAVEYLVEAGVEHLLIDLPSVDKEKDNGELLSHNAFWNTSGKIRLDATITEFIFVPNSVEDGTYFLNLMIAPFENDATPSKPVLYRIE